MDDIKKEIIYNDFPSFEPAEPEDFDREEFEAYRNAHEVKLNAINRVNFPEQYVGVPFSCYREKVLWSNYPKYAWLARKPLYINKTGYSV